MLFQIRILYTCTVFVKLWKWVKIKKLRGKNVGIHALCIATRGGERGRFPILLTPESLLIRSWVGDKPVSQNNISGYFYVFSIGPVYHFLLIFAKMQITVCQFRENFNANWVVATLLIGENCPPAGHTVAEGGGGGGERGSGISRMGRPPEMMFDSWGLCQTINLTSSKV